MKEVVVHESSREILISVLEDDSLMEAYIEPKHDASIVGSVFSGVVENVLPGMQAAFVDIGLKKNAYLYVEDVISREALSQSREKGRTLGIGDYLKKGQSVLVQIKKAPAGDKGARVTQDITLPGRYIVAMPRNRYVGISKKIQEPAERERLREIAQSLMTGETGIVVRTVAEGCSREELAQDYETLQQTWEEIRRGFEENQGRPALIRGDVEFTIRIFRDVIRKDTGRIWVKTPENLALLESYVREFIPELTGRVRMQKEEGPWPEYRIQEMLRRALKRKVWLNCGGYLIIDRVEALTIIDVNTGKYTGSKSLEETAFKVNMEAAREIARQIRLRNTGGIIVVDFIDMKEDRHRFQLVERLTEETARDIMKVQVMGMTRLGLVEMTRKKAKRSLSHLMEITCPLCRGKGQILSDENVLKLIEQKVAGAAGVLGSDRLCLRVHRKVAEYLGTTGHRFLQSLEDKYEKNIYVVMDPGLAYDEVWVDQEFPEPESRNVDESISS